MYIGSDKVALEALEGGLDGNVSSVGGCAIVSAALAMVDAAAKGNDGAAEAAFSSVSSWSASLHASPCFLGGIYWAEMLRASSSERFLLSESAHLFLSLEQVILSRIRLCPLCPESYQLSFDTLSN